MAVAEIEARITARDEASGKIRGFLGNIGQIASGVALGQIAFNGLRTAVGGVVDAIKGSFAAFQETELVTQRLNVALAQTNQATDENIKLLKEHATNLQRDTRFSDEQIMSAQALLATNRLSTQQITQLVPSMLDLAEGMSRATGEALDLDNVTKMVARAIGGEDVAGMSGALSRVGVRLSETQEALLQTGTVEEKVLLITQAVNDRFEGMATTAGATTAGKIAQLKNSFNDLQEIMGAALSDALVPLIKRLTELAQQPETVEKIKEIAAAIGSLVSIIVTAIGYLGQFLQFFINIGKAIGDVIVKITEISNSVKNFGNNLVTSFQRSAVGRFLGFQQGGIIPSTGFHFLHAGERVQPAGTVAGGGSGVVVNFYGDVRNTSNANLDDIGRRLARQLELARTGGL